LAFKSLEDTFVYKNLNKGDIISTNISKIFREGEILGQKNLEEAFIIINKNFKFPLKYKVMEDFQKGGLVLMYSPAHVKLPTSMPFFLTRNSKDEVVAIILVDLYGSMNKETRNVNIDVKKLYCIMESAYIAKLCFLNANTINVSSTVMSYGSIIYANMFTRVLNKKYALNVDRNKFNKVIFLSSKFFLINMLNKSDNEMIFNYCLKNCVEGNKFILSEVNDIFKNEDFTDLSLFINGLIRSELGLNFKDLSVRNYLESFINMYDGSALLALESFPYFMYNILAVINGAYLNNQYILEDIVQTNGTKLYQYFLNL